MKNLKKLLFVFLLAIVVLPKEVFASSFKIDENMTISIDDSIWYVFTRDNIVNNAEMEALGLSYDYMNNFFISNNAYLDALLVYQDSGDYIDLVVRKVKSDSMVNSNNYSDEQLLNTAKTLISNPTKLEVYQKNGYKYVYAMYTSMGHSMASYIIYVNGYSYGINLQKNSDLDSDNLNRFNEIVDSIVFNINTSLKEPGKSGNEGVIIPSNDNTSNNNSSSSSNNNFFDTILGKSIIGAIIGAVVGGVLALIFKLIKKGKKNQNNIPVNSYPNQNTFNNYGGNIPNNNYNNQIPQNYSNNVDMNYNNNYGNNNPNYNNNYVNNNQNFNNNYSNNEYNNNNNNNNGMY